MSWDAFCSEHWKEAKKFIKKKYGNFGWTKVCLNPDTGKNDTICGYPKCKKLADYEIYYDLDLSPAKLSTSGKFVRADSKQAGGKA